MERDAIVALQRELFEMNTGMSTAENELREIKLRVRAHACLGRGTHKTTRHRTEMGATLAHAAQLEAPRRMRVAVKGDEPPAGYKEKSRAPTPPSHGRQRPEERTQARIFPDEPDSNPPLRTGDVMRVLTPRGGWPDVAKARADALAAKAARAGAAAPVVKKRAAR
jgi:hypothetical protein